MSEEEIIKGITNIIYTCNDAIEDKEWYDQEETESAKEQLKFTEGLLDLYKKEKEKNDILQTNYEILQGEMDRIGIDTLGLESGNSTDDVIEEIKSLLKEKAKNKELKKDTKKTIDTILHKYVSKDKIKNKIEEYIETLKTAINIQTIQEFKRLKMEKFEDEFISKDKIKERIKQLEKEQEQNTKELERGIDYLSKEMIEASSKKIEINLSIRRYLQELLEGDK